MAVVGSSGDRATGAPKVHMRGKLALGTVGVALVGALVVARPGVTPDASGGPSGPFGEPTPVDGHYTIWPEVRPSDRIDLTLDRGRFNLTVIPDSAPESKQSRGGYTYDSDVVTLATGERWHHQLVNGASVLFREESWAAWTRERRVDACGTLVRLGAPGGEGSLAPLLDAVLGAEWWRGVRFPDERDPAGLPAAIRELVSARLPRGDLQHRGYQLALQSFTRGPPPETIAALTRAVTGEWGPEARAILRDALRSQSGAGREALIRQLIAAASDDLDFDRFREWAAIVFDTLAGGRTMVPLPDPSARLLLSRSDDGVQLQRRAHGASDTWSGDILTPALWDEHGRVATAAFKSWALARAATPAGR